MRRLLVLFPFAFVFILNVHTQAQVLRLREGQFSFFTQYKTFNTTSNFDATGGSFTRLDPGKSYSHSLMSFKMQYDFSTSLTSYGGFNYSTAESNDGSFTRSNSSLSGFEGGIQYKALKVPFLIVPQIHFVLPFDTIKGEGSSDKVLTSEGVIEVEAGSWFQKKLWILYNYAYLGLDYRSDGRSALGKYKVGTYTRLRSIYLGTEVDGFNSITDDSSTDNPAYKTWYTDLVNGGSLTFYSVNPNLLNATVWGGFIVSDNYLFKIGYTQALNGKSHARGNTFFVGLDIRNFYMRTQSERLEIKRDNRLKQINTKFEPEEDTLDDGDIDEDAIERELEIQIKEDQERH